jgi:hypothetical protein
MADEEANLTDEERAELEHPVIEDEDVFGVEDAADEDLDTPSDLPGDIEDDSGFLEKVVDDGDPVLNEDEGTRVGMGSV